jgi:dTDP-4-amino-4,6-dideoxygalactose transaminase
MASTLTFIGSVTPATFQGATPVFIDCDESSWNMDPALLEQALEDAARRGQLPKAVIPTDLYGQPCDLPRIRAICDRHGVPVVCDAAEAMGAKYQGTGDRGQGTGNRGAEYPISNIQCPITKETVGPRTSDLGPRTSGPWRHAGFDAWASVFSFNGNKIITTSGGGMLASHDQDLVDHARKLSQQARDPVAVV